MSWVTNTIVLPSSPCSRRNSSCSCVPDHRVDRAERLVHQHHRRVRGQRPGDADPLLLAAGELGRVALGRARSAARPAPAAPSPAAGPSSGPSRAAAARSRRCRRSCGAGTARPAGSRSRCRGAARPASTWRCPGRRARSVPEVGSTIRLIIRSEVVLPQPDGPTSTVICPDGATRSRPSTAVVPSGYRFTTESNLITGITASVSGRWARLAHVYQGPLTLTRWRVDRTSRRGAAVALRSGSGRSGA